MPQMGRRRQTKLNLPPRMHVKSGTYYYVTSTVPRKWISLGRDIVDARRKWAELETGAPGASLALLIDEWMATEAYTELALNTRRVYKSAVKQLKAVFAEFQSVADIKPHHVAAWLDEHGSKVMANTGKSILSNVLAIAVRRGLIERNPAREVDNLEVKRRKRYLTDDEYLAIRSHAHPVLAAAMDLSYVTGARIGDVIEIRLAHISADGMLIRQEKTGKLQLFRRNPALDKALEAARSIPRPVRGLYLLCTERGRKYQYAVLNRWWIEARTAASVEDARFHDIRGKSATDAKRGGQDYQALLGHTTKAMSDSYIKLEDAQVVEPLRNVL